MFKANPLQANVLYGNIQLSIIDDSKLRIGDRDSVSNFPSLNFEQKKLYLGFFVALKTRCFTMLRNISNNYEVVYAFFVQYPCYYGQKLAREIL